MFCRIWTVTECQLDLALIQQGYDVAKRTVGPGSLVVAYFLVGQRATRGNCRDTALETGRAILWRAMLGIVWHWHWIPMGVDADTRSEGSLSIFQAPSRNAHVAVHVVAAQFPAFPTLSSPLLQPRKPQPWSVLRPRGPPFLFP